MFYIIQYFFFYLALVIIWEIGYPNFRYDYSSKSAVIETPLLDPSSDFKQQIVPKALATVDVKCKKEKGIVEKWCKIVQNNLVGILCMKVWTLDIDYVLKKD